MFKWALFSLHKRSVLLLVTSLVLTGNQHCKQQFLQFYFLLGHLVSRPVFIWLYVYLCVWVCLVVCLPGYLTVYLSACLFVSFVNWSTVVGLSCPTIFWMKHLCSVCWLRYHQKYLGASQLWLYKLNEPTLFFTQSKSDRK